MKPARTLTFDRYHTAEVMYEWLYRWEEQYPNLVKVWEVDRSFEGRPILMATITNEATGRPRTNRRPISRVGGTPERSPAASRSCGS